MTAEHFLDTLLSTPLDRAAPTWLTQLRERAALSANAMGVPTSRAETWRYLRLAPFFSTTFTDAPLSPSTLSVAAIKPFLLEGSLPIVIINGVYQPQLSTALLPAGLQIESFKHAAAMPHHFISTQLGTRVPFDHTIFTALNTAYANEGIIIDIAPKTALEAPIHLLCLSTQTPSPQMHHLRHLIRIGKGSAATIVTTSIGLDASIYLNNTVAEITLDDDASLTHVMLQADSRAAFHFSTVGVSQSKNSRFSNHVFSLGSRIGRTDISIDLVGEHTQTHANGLFIGTSDQQLAEHLRVDHRAPNSSSRTLYKGIADDRARGIFDGKVVVHLGAEKTDAKQSTQNLLLSDEAEIHPKPQLEIFADDVKCAHGATVGQVDDNALFYLRSRGIDEAHARRLLTYAFASDLVGHLGHDRLRDYIMPFVQSALSGGKGD